MTVIAGATDGVTAWLAADSSGLTPGSDCTSWAFDKVIRLVAGHPDHKGRGPGRRPVLLVVGDGRADRRIYDVALDVALGAMRALDRCCSHVPLEQLVTTAVLIACDEVSGCSIPIDVDSTAVGGR